MDSPKNADKGFHEEFRPSDSPIRFAHPFRACVLGKINSGKSMICKNILMAAQARNPKFEELWIIHGDIETKEYDDCCPTVIRSDVPELEELDCATKKLIILDDIDFTSMSKEQKANLSNLFRYGSTHRNCSVILSHQSFFSVLKICKDQSNIFILWRPTDLDTLTAIGRRVGLKKEQIRKMFNDHLPHWRDSLLINLDDDAPSKYSKNLFEPLLDPNK